MRGNQIRIHRLIKMTKVEGFGNRYAIWVQGCKICCPGCKNKHLWNFEGGKRVGVNNIIEDITMQKDIEGITFLGGEPLDQKDAVSKILEATWQMGLTNIVFTGYKYEDLIQQKDAAVQEILRYTDVLIDGPYIQEQQDFSRPWIGSKNQKYRFLSNKYSEIQLREVAQANQYELRIEKNGKVSINGMGDLAKIEKILTLGGEEYEKVENNNISKWICSNRDGGGKRKSM